MKPTLFEFDDYKKYLNAWISSRPRRGHGEKAKIAHLLKCHPTYVSQVLAGKVHFSPEQAQALNQHLGHTDEESEFFLMLVLQARAGTRELEAFYGKKISQFLEHRMILKNRLQFKKALTPEDQATYYSAWYYTAIHFLVTIPEFQTEDAIEKRLGLPKETVSKALNFLQRIGLIESSGKRIKASVNTIHLGNDSEMILRHHSTWRMRAILALEKETKDELHYTSVVTIAKKDAAKIKSALISAIEQVRSVVQPSAEEELFCYSLDFFKI